VYNTWANPLRPNPIKFRGVLSQLLSVPLSHILDAFSQI
jgi:hypothetical protein